MENRQTVNSLVTASIMDLTEEQVAAGKGNLEGTARGFWKADGVMAIAVDSDQPNYWWQNNQWVPVTFLSLSTTATLSVTELKEEDCPVCKGTGKVKMRSVAFILGAKEPSQDTKDMAQGMLEDDTCPACDGSGKIVKPPYEDGNGMQMAGEKVSEIASAATLMRNMGDPAMIQAVANQAARITLPEHMVDLFVEYWSSPKRDVNLGEYIRQIAETAEKLAVETFGDLGNPIFAGPRACPWDQTEEDAPPVPDMFHYHEVLETAHVLHDSFEAHVVTSVAVSQTPELKVAAEATAQALFDFYTLAGKHASLSKDRELGDKEEQK